jgi:hypothetical protein
MADILGHPIDSAAMAPQISFDIKPIDGGTKVTLVHRGLVPRLECYDACSAGWEQAAGRSLRAFIETGHGIRF